MVPGRIDGYFLIMVALVLASLVLPLLHRFLTGRPDREVRNALWLAAAPVLPAVAFLIERAARSVGVAAEIEQHRYTVFWPWLFGTGCGAVFILASFTVVRPLRRSIAVDAIRLVQVATWLLSAATVLLSIAAV
jgi:hypothetical protein